MDVVISECLKDNYEAIYLLFKNELGYQNLNYNSFCQRLTMMLQSENYHLLVAYNNDQVAGFVAFEKAYALEIEGAILRVIALAVSSKYQGQKIGTKLMNAAELYANENQITTITLNSGLQRLKTHEFYLKQGYMKKGYSFIKKNI